jgi:hypothetical protein
MSLLVVSAMTAALAIGPGVQAQGPTPGTFCALITAEEASTALQVAVTPSGGTDLDCAYATDPESSTYLSLYTRAEGGTLESIKGGWPDGEDLPIGGKPAWYVEDLLWTEIGGRLLTLQLVSFGIAGLDHKAALSSLAEIGVGRWDSLSIPDATPEPTNAPEPSFVGDPELDALFPTEIGGSPLEVQSMNGQELLGQIDTSNPDDTAVLKSLTDALASQGKTIDDMSIGYAFGSASSIFGVRVKGIDISVLQEQILPIFTTNMAEPQEGTAQIVGKTVTVITDGPDSPEAQKLYAYPKNDVLWLVSATDPILTEIFQKLP